MDCKLHDGKRKECGLEVVLGCGGFIGSEAYYVVMRMCVYVCVCVG